MPATANRPVLTTSQAACLIALRDGKDSKSAVAVHAKIDLYRANSALLALEDLGLARRSETKSWRATARGQKCRFKTIAEKSRVPAQLGHGLQRVLDALDRPMRGRDLAEKLGVTVQCVHSHIVTLYARGYIRLACPDHVLLSIARIDDDTPLLSPHEERVLSAIPGESATTLAKIKLAARLPERQAHHILDNLIPRGFIRSELGLMGETVYSLTPAGHAHPQRSTRIRPAQLPSLPLRSDRVRSVLSAIQELGAVRITDLGRHLHIPQDSIRALMQYLKRKKMVCKQTQDYNAPYILTEYGIRTLYEMTRRLAA